MYVIVASQADAGGGDYLIGLGEMGDGVHGTAVNLNRHRKRPLHLDHHLRFQRRAQGRLHAVGPLQVDAGFSQSRFDRAAGGADGLFLTAVLDMDGDEGADFQQAGVGFKPISCKKAAMFG